MGWNHLRNVHDERTVGVAFANRLEILVFFTGVQQFGTIGLGNLGTRQMLHGHFDSSRSNGQPGTHHLADQRFSAEFKVLGLQSNSQLPDNTFEVLLFVVRNRFGPGTAGFENGVDGLDNHVAEVFALPEFFHDGFDRQTCNEGSRFSE